MKSPANTEPKARAAVVGTEPTAPEPSEAANDSDTDSEAASDEAAKVEAANDTDSATTGPHSEPAPAPKAAQASAPANPPANAAVAATPATAPTRSSRRKKKSSTRSRAGLEPNNVRKLRQEAMMSKAELARRAGVSPLTIDRVEAGCPCRMDTKRKILEALGLKPSARAEVWPHIDAQS